MVGIWAVRFGAVCRLWRCRSSRRMETCCSVCADSVGRELLLYRQSQMQSALSC
ncbi:hypothetical protein M758_4G096200 [Ceratodon purpureus]|nr:hypothetical protein M758_4G096200 [Ceratodon purpureus]